MREAQRFLLHLMRQLAGGIGLPDDVGRLVRHDFQHGQSADVVQHACICPLRRRTKACRKIRGKRRDILKMLDEQLTIRVHVGRAVCKISQLIAPPFRFGNSSIQ